MKLNGLFNWLAEKPKNNLTLGELCQELFPRMAINQNACDLTRAGRAWERAHIGLALLDSAVAFSKHPISANLLAGAALYIGLAKVLGLGMGKVVDHVVRVNAGP